MSSWLLPVLITLGLIVLNGLFVAAEFAIVSVPRTALEHRAAGGDRMARRVGHIVRHPQRQDQYLATAQLGITVASLGLGMYGEQALAGWLGTWLAAFGPLGWAGAHALASVIALAALTYVHIVIGEMVPKALALQQPVQTAIVVTPVMIWVQRLLYPLVVGLNGLGNRLLRLVGVDRQQPSHHQYHTPEELEFIIKESAEGGLLRAEAGRVLRELFEFADLTAVEAMVPRVKIAGIPLGARPEEIARIVRARRYTRYPVYTGDLDHIAGVIHIKRLLRCLLDNRPLQKEDIAPVPYVPEAATLDTVLAVMRREHVHMAIVMDEHGGTAGLISLTDLFEEIAGEIDEEVTGLPSITRDASSRLSVDGTVRLDEVGEALNIVLEHEEVDTVSGIILTLLSRPPQVGDTVTYGAVRFEVTAIEGRGVRRAVVTRTARRDGGGHDAQS